jgi:general secretion pathway protein G
MNNCLALRRFGASSTRRPRAASGFTLTEILIAIALLVTVVAVAVENLGNIFSGGATEVAQSFVSDTVNAPLMAYHLSTGSYPTSDQGLQALVNPPDGITGWRGPYMDQVPADPWGRPYQYAFPGPHNGSNKPDVWSMGPDNAESSIIGNWPATTSQ